ncbi:hypothetical protein JTB14_027196 [Gonioctena quinquepunctata]|nr:hypothetical protein JTB14_027196 [Gonioctena quinquepunctata]
MSEGRKLHQYIAAACICIGSLATGTLLGWTANITDDLKSGELNSLKMNDDELGWVGSCMTLGALVMCFPSGWMADLMGRKPTVLLSIIPFTGGWLLISFAQHISMIYVGRFLVGIGGGCFSVVAPLYTSEIAQTEIRGTLGTFFQLSITMGILFSYVLGYLMPLMAFNIACLIVPLVFGVLFFFQPESPVWDLRKGKNVAAEKSFRRFRGKDYDTSNEVALIMKDIEEEKSREKFWVLMRSKAAKRANLICFGLMFYQQLSGINAVMFYSGEIFIASGSTLSHDFSVIIIGVVQVIATVFSSWAIEKAGRKLLLILSASFMALSTFFLGLFFTLKNYELLDKKGIEMIGFLPVLSLVIFIIAFSIGFGPIPWLASSEIFSPDIKSKCSSAVATWNWILAFFVTKFYLNFADSIGNDITFYIFTVITITGIFFVLFLLPETKNKTFEDIQKEIGG